MASAVHRKPLPPAGAAAVAPRPASSIYSSIVPDVQYMGNGNPQQSHSRTRTTSSNVLPGMASEPRPQPSSQQQFYAQRQQIPSHTQNQPSSQGYGIQHQPPAARRTLSNATTSTSSTGGLPQRKNSASSSTLQRTTSGRSMGPPSYVAMMRKQKATVWSDRAQLEDPRLLAQQRAAKQRAFAEVSNKNLLASGRVPNSSGGVRSKIRHHGAPKAQQYAPTAFPGSGVPMRLSAREVDEEESDDDQSARRNTFHRRTGSGQSSLGSGSARFNSGYGLSPSGPNAGSSNSTPPNGFESSQTGVGLRQRTESATPVPDHFQRADYFDTRMTETATATAPSTGTPPGQGSGDSEREDSFGEAKALPRRARILDEERKTDAADLQRRGSVDERTMTMSGYGKLFVANPDVDD